MWSYIRKVIFEKDIFVKNYCTTVVVVKKMETDDDDDDENVDHWPLAGHTFV
jgi:hypothetical protein